MVLLPGMYHEATIPNQETLFICNKSKTSLNTNGGNMKRLLFIIIIIFLTYPLYATTIAISDLSVESANPSYKYIGKGIAELISSELSKSKDITIISREKRSEIMKEVEFAMLTGEQQLEMGRMLAAQYIVSGKIIDMVESVIITVSITDVQTGKIIWQDKLTEKLSKYEYISAYFAKGILQALNTTTDTSTIAKIEKQQEKNEKAVVALSNAINAIDKNDTEKARSQLQQARSLDPENEVIKDYLAKLSVTSSKFKVELDFYVPSQNPAVLGTIQQDRIYWIFTISQDNLGGGKVEPKDVGDDYRLDEAGNVVNRIGYEFPIGQRWGMNVEFMASTVDPKVETPYDFWIGDTQTNYFHPLAEHFGISIGLGYAITDWLSVGGSIAAYSSNVRQQESGNTKLYQGSDASFGGGFLLTLLNRQLYIDSYYTFNTEQEYYLPPYTSSTPAGERIALEAHYPSVWETTITGVFFNRRVFAVLKQLTDFYTSAGAASSEYKRDGIASRTIPSIEVWPFNWLSLRAGYIYMYTDLMQKTNSGDGFVGGFTLRLGTWDFDVNYTIMERVSRLLPGYETTDKRFLFQLTKHATFITSR